MELENASAVVRTEREDENQPSQYTRVGILGEVPPGHSESLREVDANKQARKQVFLSRWNRSPNVCAMILKGGFSPRYNKVNEGLSGT